ncbi:thioredoxin reductase 3-like [Rhincodon typus]|uniref:thioredoxin reductase 3-like n=1 Tax=Rhincodon typus TaxID=259920 RepID=UPI002030A9A5|nr:thioredoxin reductase 3-like [Rhincodon typus]
MPPTGSTVTHEELKLRIQRLIDSHNVLVFSKTFCPYCKKVKELFRSLDVDVHVVELDLLEEGSRMQDVLLEMTGQKTVPSVFVNKAHVGGCDKTVQAHEDGLLKKLLEGGEMYDFDLIVIGGGSGGLAASKEAASFGRKVLVLDYVVPTPMGTSWGLGGTCVNVGCIPKKLMHQAALLGQGLMDSRKFGWEFDEKVHHNWGKMKEAIQNYIGSLNWGYRVALRDKKVTYNNSYAEFVEPHKIKVQATVIGFLAAVAAVVLGSFSRGNIDLNQTAVLCASSTITAFIAALALVYFRCIIRNGKILVDNEERSNIPYIYGIGDVIDGKPELTPVAIQAGKLLARRLYAGSTMKCDYVNVCTTVFTPLEYGCCGLSEENAIALYGEEHVEVYHSMFWPLEWAVPGRDKNGCYGKVICAKLDHYRVVGFHVLGPNAGEITQGFGAAMKCGMTKDQLNSVIGIHPTCAEVFTSMEITKRSGLDISKKGGC